MEFFGDEIDRISEINVVTGEVLSNLSHIAVFPASHYIVGRDKMREAIEEIKQELDERIKYFKERDMLIEAQRIEQRTNYDIEMLEDMIIVAYNDASKKVDSDKEKKLGKYGNGLSGLM